MSDCLETPQTTRACACHTLAGNFFSGGCAPRPRRRDGFARYNLRGRGAELQTRNRGAHLPELLTVCPHNERMRSQRTRSMQDQGHDGAGRAMSGQFGVPERGSGLGSCAARAPRGPASYCVARSSYGARPARPSVRSVGRRASPVLRYGGPQPAVCKKTPS